MRIIGISTGNVRGKLRERGLRRYAPGGWSEGTLPVNVFAVEHPDGVCLFDAGQTARAAEPGYLPRWHPFLRLARFELTPDDEAAAQLARRGIPAERVRWIVLSHLHTDHVGGVGAFPGAQVLVSRIEWDLASGVAGRLRGYVPQHWPRSLTPRVVDLTGPPVGPFPASLDLAGDGVLVLVPTPGHTPGHISMLVRGAGTWLCAGDLVHQPEELRAVDPQLDDWCREEDVTVLTAHDPRVAVAA